MKHKILVALLAIAACTSKSPQQNEEPRQFVDLAGLDSTIRPGDDFFMHVNGKWYNSVQIDEDQVGVGSYSYLNIPQRKLLETILEEVSGGQHSKGSIEQKVGDFYASGMDTTTINSRGIAPIQPILAQIDQISNLNELENFLVSEMKFNNQSLIGLRISPDDQNSTINIIHLSQTGLGLPDRDYYFKTDSSTLGIQKAYQKYLATLLVMAGENESNAQTAAQTVYALEKQLAESHKTRIERRVVKENYHKVAVADLDKKHTNISWKSIFDNLGLKADSLDIRQPAYYDKLNALLQTQGLEDWKAYLKAQTLVANANYLSTPFRKAAFEYNKAVSGQSKQLTRAQQMVQQVDQNLGFDLGQLYVKRYFNEAAKQRVLDLVNNLQKAFEQRINQLDWMSDSTKTQAKEKLYAITKKIGYPDKWREYPVEINRETYFENVLALRKNEADYQFKKLGKAPDKTEWGTTPSTVTAYYNPSLNEIVFPAGILQYPYFDQNADDAINYGGIGMVIGHELTHAFDDQGAQFDKDGNLKNWWSKADYEKFKAKTQLLIDRYDTFTVLDSVPIKGAMTIGENTADNGGIYIAYDAFKLTPQGQDTTKIDGFTPDQRFSYSIARIWRVKVRDEYMRTYVVTNSHSPAMWRVNGPLMNFDPFYAAYGVKPGDKNYKAPEERIKIW
jgi:putative endopeptidase